MIAVDVGRAKAVASLLLAAYRDHGIFGNQAMPEDVAPHGVEVGSEDHLRFITLTVAIDYMRDADQLWEASRRTFADPRSRYLFDPPRVADTRPASVIRDMQIHKLSKKYEQDARTWQQICSTLTRHFEGQVSTLLNAAGQDAQGLLALVQGSRYGSGFPFLKGPKISPLWIRMLHDNCGVDLRRLSDIPLPVDVHTAQATIQTGCVRAVSRQGTMEELRQAVQRVWKEALADSADGSYPLQLDEPLWMLSRQGCRKTSTWPCTLRSQCAVAAYCEPEHLWLNMTDNPNQDGNEWLVEVR